ncbi:hypothetical protein [Streptomyces chrestomyceticus]
MASGWSARSVRVSLRISKFSHVTRSCSSPDPTARARGSA